MTKAFLRVLVASLLVTGALAVAALLAGGFGGLQGRILLSTLGLAAASGIGLAASVGRTRNAQLAAATVAAAGTGYVLALAEIWIADGGSEPLGKAIGVLAVLAVDGAYLVLLLAWRRPHDPLRIRLASGTGAAGVSLAALAICGAILWGGGDALGRAAGVLAVVGVVGSLVSVVLRRLAARAPRAAVDPLVGRRIVAVDRAAKRLVLTLDDGESLVAAVGGRVDEPQDG